jgi:UDP-N-acetylmuramoylalanine--D-glutamate ligase
MYNHESTFSLCPKQQIQYILDNIADKSVAILGLGLLGGGEGATRFFAERGARVTVTDLKTEAQLARTLDRLADLPLEYHLGGHPEDVLLQMDLIVANPAVPRTSRLLAQCHREGIPVTSPMNVFLSLCAGHIAAVTGSVGKSTTSSMLAAMLKADNRQVYLGGNIGGSLLPYLNEINRGEHVVLELSSVQLEDAAYLPWSPEMAVVTNIMPNHLDRYKTIEAYARAKYNIVKYQKSHDCAVLNYDDSILRRWGLEGEGGKRLFFTNAGHGKGLVDGINLRNGRLLWQKDGKQRVICTSSELELPGEHNAYNAMAATAAACELGVSQPAIQRALANFQTLEHRLEECSTASGRTFYNDSDSTTPASTIAALDALQKPITLIAGGVNKNVDLRPLAEEIAGKVEVLVTLGKAGPEIAQITREAGIERGHTPVIKEANSLEDAVSSAFELSMPGTTVLFSPACSSFDMFDNFAQRGRCFKRLVNEITTKKRRLA